MILGLSSVFVEFFKSYYVVVAMEWIGLSDKTPDIEIMDRRKAQTTLSQSKQTNYTILEAP
jgi:hypothetical protein